MLASNSLNNFVSPPACISAFSLSLSRQVMHHVSYTELRLKQSWLRFLPVFCLVQHSRHFSRPQSAPCQGSALVRVSSSFVPALSTIFNLVPDISSICSSAFLSLLASSLPTVKGTNITAFTVSFTLGFSISAPTLCISFFSFSCIPFLLFSPQCLLVVSGATSSSLFLLVLYQVVFSMIFFLHLCLSVDFALL